MVAISEARSSLISCVDSFLPNGYIGLGLFKRAVGFVLGLLRLLRCLSVCRLLLGFEGGLLLGGFGLGGGAVLFGLLSCFLSGLGICCGFGMCRAFGGFLGCGLGGAPGVFGFFGGGGLLCALFFGAADLFGGLGGGTVSGFFFCGFFFSGARLLGGGLCLWVGRRCGGV